MKELIQEIEKLEADIKSDLGLEDALISTQSILQTINGYRNLIKPKEKQIRESRLGMLRMAINRLDFHNLECEENTLADKLKGICNQDSPAQNRSGC
ncbi:hypothetical protein CWI42_011340 [Ordospora colligata]|uniref:Uncharacterized protein n=1 Tax=Ordospora colligata OC4 TaxID=1354746 RepID=A0A0B2UND9_9MICR|nr:uncharacterized protein M896_011340 [Ordospora colligata OC4]KHN70480.1 hypothetical protein M896_011340 [Ordospora colligata OC4]TBU17230.1 hypothetical protein CWI41_011340 [Ordospora colligata]TBU17480.1 hypothetical protein CWI40_011340 [Ordospora colligata]TBU19660.1 hypothetical protein CWI42_011340 [Ordospora colligata]